MLRISGWISRQHQNFVSNFVTCVYTIIDSRNSTKHCWFQFQKITNQVSDILHSENKNSQRQTIELLQERVVNLRLARILLKRPCICSKSPWLDHIYELVEGMRNMSPLQLPVRKEVLFVNLKCIRPYLSLEWHN